MVGAGHQRESIGTAAIGLAADEVRSRGGTELYTSWMPGDGSPGPFYEHIGFVPTGELDENEVVARLSLVPLVPES